MEHLFNKSSTELVNEILEINNIDNLLLYGRYKLLNGFGTFKNVKHDDGKYLIYPYINETIEDVYINTTELKDGTYYSFFAELSSKKYRKKYNNPYLLQSIDSEIQQIEKLTITKKEVEAKTEIINEQKAKLEAFEQDYERIKQTKQNEIDNIVDTYNVEINNVFEKLQHNKETLKEYESKLDDLNKKIHQKQTNIINMENTIHFLKEKISICKNLEFISKSNANKYLLQLDQVENFEIDGTINFEKKFDGGMKDTVHHILHYLYKKKNLIYTEFQIRNFLALLQTNDLIILSGLSGSGKTQIVKAIAEVIGGVAKIIPVKPNWLSSDDLLGYYNPLNSSFLPTPFTEAIVEATQNPNQMYLVCLDEMNLARVEYYFADFLSKLEDRDKQPEIELFAKHEEEVILSEFKSLLNLMEISMGNENIESWKGFIENDVIRSRFFELLGSNDDSNILKIHSKMKRRILDILKFPSSIKLPSNVRFIGAINVDETTNYFSPKILDRVHIVRFENPLLFEKDVETNIKYSTFSGELLPLYIHPKFFGKREELPTLKNEDHKDLINTLKEINKKFLLPLNIDFGVRSIRQSINYAIKFRELTKIDNTDDDFTTYCIILNTLINQKILPRLLFEDTEINNGKTKKNILEEFVDYLKKDIGFLTDQMIDFYLTGCLSNQYLSAMINGEDQINFWNTSIQNVSASSTIDDTDPF